jgi:ABC-type glycerol-3-phosphate transport system substrate-binding protein
MMMLGNAAIRLLMELIYTSNMRSLAVLLLAFSILVSGCGNSEEDNEEPVLTQEVEKPTPAATPTEESKPESTSEPGLSPAATLNVWISNQFLGLNDPLGGTVLEEQIAAFQSDHPELTMNIEGKITSGSGGILNYLQAGSGIASSILPDLILLPSQDMDQAVSRDIVYPLDDLLEQEMIDDLFPASIFMGQVDGTTYGYPFSFTDMHHLVYDGEVISEEFPDTWEDMLEVEDADFAFPANGHGGAEMVLQLYLAAGGSLVDDANLPLLEVEPLTQALSQLNRGTTRRFILRESANLTTIDEVWQMHLDSDAVIVQSEASYFLREVQSSPDSSPARVPGYESALRPFVNGWVWAITTDDPTRQALAAEMLETIASAKSVGEWTMATNQLPARRSAYTHWPVNDPLTRFYLQASEHAHQFPEEANDQIMEALNNAAVHMINLTKSPRSAAEEAAQSLDS